MAEVTEKADQDREAVIDIENLQEASKENKQIEIPEGGRKGWMAVASVFFFNCATWASNSAYSVYLAHYLQYDTFSGATKLDYAAIGGIAFGCGLLFGPLVKLYINLTNVRFVIVLGAILQFTGLILAAFSKKLWQIYCTQGLLIGFGLAFVSMPSMTIIPQWFRRKRSLAASIAAAGSGVGGIIFNLSIQAMVANLGLRWALIIQAIMSASCTCVGIILLRTRNNEIRTVLKIWDWSILSYGIYWMYVLHVSLALLGYVVLMYNLADFTKSLGYSAHQGSIVSCMISVGIVFGRPTVGKLCDRFGAVTTTVCAHLLVSTLCFAMWIPARNFATAIAFALIQGGSMGTIWVVIAIIMTRLVGLRRLDVGLCMMWIPIGVSGLVSPIIGIKLRGSAPKGAQYDPSQYKYPAIWCGVVYLASAVCMLLIRSYLISRDRVAEKSSSKEDNDELHIPVRWTSWFKDMFSSSPNRKV